MEIVEKIKAWGEEKGINNPDNQLNKLAEEGLEAKEALVLFREHGNENNYNHLLEELGDIGVVWVLLCQALDVDIEDALKKAHDKNKDRTGRTIRGNFLKDQLD